jgi:hypothetical protein
MDRFIGSQIHRQTDEQKDRWTDVLKTILPEDMLQVVIQTIEKIYI